MLIPTDWLEHLFPIGEKTQGVKVLNAAERANVKIELVINRLMELGLCEGRALWLRVHEQRTVPYKSIPVWDDTILARVNVVEEMQATVTDCIGRNARYEGPIALEILGHRETYLAECLPIGQDRALAILTADS
jgi:hypothetical protein